MDNELSNTLKEYKNEIEKLNNNSKELKILMNNALKVVSEPAIQVAMQSMVDFSNKFSHLVVENYATALSNIVIPEITKSIINNDYLIQTISNTSLAMQEMIKSSVYGNIENIANALRIPLLQSIPHFKLQINEIISNLPDLQPTYIALNKLNFSKYVWTEIPSEEFTDELINASDIDKTIDNYNKNHTIEIAEKCLSTDFIKSKKELFIEAIDNYKKGNYQIAVMAMTSLIDGFMSFMTNNKTSNFGKRKDIILQTIQDKKHLISEDDELLTIIMTSECMLNSFFVRADFNEKEPELINRHWIMHCQTTKKYTEYEFKKVLFFLHGLIRLYELSKK